MNKIQIANILATQRCNISCEYCHITKNYKGMPKEYPNMNYYARNEIKASEWIKIFERLKKNNSEIFFLLYGGEIFLYPELKELLIEMHKQDMPYSIISNNTDSIQSKIKEIGEAIGGYIGFTSSVDPVIFDYSEPELLTSRKQKSLAGLDRLCKMKRDGLCNDVVAEVVTDAGNISMLYDTVKILSSKGIVSSISTVDEKKSPYYDFSYDTPKDLLLTKELAHSEFEKIINDKSLLVHMPEILPVIESILPSEYKCKLYKDITNVTLSPDGRFRLCLRVRGTYTSDKRAEELIDENGKINGLFNSCMSEDYNKYCLGCCWTCLLFSELGTSEEIIKHVKM